MATFRERLSETARAHDSWLCVGLDPDASRGKHGESADDVATFLLDIIDRTGDLVCCYKPNSAFFEALGDDAHTVAKQVIDAARRHAPVILDAKRGDIGNTAAAYARWAYDILDADAITIAPYMGHDSVAPFSDRAERGVFVLARTSNPGAADLQSLRLEGGEPLYERVARLATTSWNPHGNVGLVAGATAPAELGRIREIAGPDALLLIPGVGAQGGSAADAIRLGANKLGENAIINSSRGVLYAKDPAEAARTLRDELNRHRPRA